MKDSLDIVCPWCGGVDSNDCIYYHTDFKTQCAICGKPFDVVTRRNSKDDKWETYKYVKGDKL